MEPPEVNPVSSINPVTPDWLNYAQQSRYPASMEFWYPRLTEVSGLNLPQTEWVSLQASKVDEGTIHEMYSATYDFSEVKSALDSIGIPAFVRTDQASDGRQKGGACIESHTESEIRSTIGAVLDFNITWAEVPFCSLVIQEWIDKQSVSEADFGVEVRFFIENGEVLNWGFYWPESDVNINSSDYSHLQRIAKENITQIIPSVQKIAERFDGVNSSAWSVDFVLSKDTKWYCTDMAPKEMSMEPENLYSV